MLRTMLLNPAASVLNYTRSRVFSLLPTRLANTVPSLSQLRSLSFTPFRLQATKGPMQVGANNVTIDWTRISTVQTSSREDQFSKFHYVWLRDHCPCSKCIHPHNRQKLHQSGDFDVGIKPKSVEFKPEDGVLQVVWDGKEPHTSVYPLKWLRENCYDAWRQKQRREMLKPKLWDTQALNKVNLRVPYADYINTEAGLKQTLELLHNYGLAFLTDVPVDNDRQVEVVAKRIGEIKDTFYGVSWDVKSKPQAKNIAYTSLFLGLHMDLMYFESPPGIQFLHSLANSVEGGASIFLDIYQAAEILKKESPEDYNVLKNTLVTYHYDNDNHHLVFKRPVITENDPNEYLRVFYGPPFQGVISDIPSDQVEPFYKAMSKFETILKDPKLIYETRLTPGTCVLFANRRVLHGRTAFEADSGARHFKGTYIDWDVMKDKLRVLRRRLD